MRVNIVLAISLCSAMAQAQIPLPGGPPRPWVSPGRLYAVEIPNGWQIYVDDKVPTRFEMHPLEAEAEVVLIMERINVPKGAHPKQLMLNALEQRLQKLPSWHEVGRRDAKLAAGRGAAVAGSYYHQGNAQYPRAIEEVFVVQGDEAYVFHFECFEPLAPRYSGDLDRVYKSFFPHPPAGFGDEEAPQPARLEPIVNPDRVAY